VKGRQGFTIAFVAGLRKQEQRAEELRSRIGKQRAAMTPAFPQNGPGCKPVFDDIELLLMDKHTPPEALLKHMEEFGNEFEAGTWLRGAGQPDSFLNVPWPKVGGDSELDKLCQPDSLLSWDFNLFTLKELANGNPLAVIAYAILQSHDLVSKLKMDDTVLKRYLFALETTYNQCLYHNPMHAADVMHATNYFLQGDLANAISSEELLITLLSGPVHDLGHPGVNNMLLIKQEHPVAVKYNNKSVLENHHAWIALELLKQPVQPLPYQRHRIQVCSRSSDTDLMCYSASGHERAWLLL